jgi:hypothetical protein
MDQYALGPVVRPEYEIGSYSETKELVAMAKVAPNTAEFTTHMAMKLTNPSRSLDEEIAANKPTFPSNNLTSNWER